jgi:hypothetical protein
MEVTVMPPKKTEKLTVMIDDDLKQRLAAVAFAGDLTPSDLVRSCILLALPVLESRPALITIIPTLPEFGNRGIAG